MRHDDLQEKAYFRSSERLFRVNSAWYFSAREGDQGPFDSEETAARELQRYIEEQVSLHKFIKSGVKVVVMDEVSRSTKPRQPDHAVDTFEQLGMVI